MDLSLFKFEKSPVRVIIDKEGALWFVGKDVCGALGYVNPRDAISKHLQPKHKDAVAICDATGRNQQTTIISKSAVFRLAMRSKTQKAEAFQEWVEEVVLPSIFNSGSYIMERSRAEVVRQKESIMIEAKQIPVTYADTILIRRIINGSYSITEATNAMARFVRLGFSHGAIEFRLFGTFTDIEEPLMIGNTKLLEAS